MDSSGSRKQKGKVGEDRLARIFQTHGYKVLARDAKVSEERTRVDFLLEKNRQLFLVEVKNHFFVGSGFEVLLSEKQRNGYLRMAMAMRRNLPQYRAYEIFFWFIALKNDARQAVTLERFKIL